MIVKELTSDLFRSNGLNLSPGRRERFAFGRYLGIVICMKIRLQRFEPTRKVACCSHRKRTLARYYSQHDMYLIIKVE